MELDQAELSRSLIDAARRNDNKQVLFYLECGAPVNGIDEYGRSAWNYAMSYGDAGKELRAILLQKNAASAPPLDEEPIAIAQPATQVTQKAQTEVQAVSEQSNGWGSWLKSGLSFLASGSKMLITAAAQGAAHYSSSLVLRKKITEPDVHSYEAAFAQSSLDKVATKEAEYIEHRKKAGREALQAFVGGTLVITDKDLITVGSCFSGGGVRATLETLGWLKGAQNIGFFPLMHYMAGLSGSTWVLNPWVASGLTLDQFTQKLLPRLEKSLTDYIRSMTKKDLSRVLITLGRKFYNQLSVGPVDLYGILLAELFLRDIVKNPHECTLSSLSASLQEGNYPFVLSTAVVTNEDGKAVCEFSPFTIGSHELGSFIPTWSFGRIFKNGQSTIVQPSHLFKAEELLTKGVIDVAAKLSTKMQKKSTSFKAGVERLMNECDSDDIQSAYYGRELTLGYLMGIWGSAFAVDIYSLLHELKRRLSEGYISPEELDESAGLMQANLIALITQKCFEWGTSSDALAKLQGSLKNDHVGAATIGNFANKSSSETVSVIDGGFYTIDHNRLSIAITPLLTRNLHLITICDSTLLLEGAPALRAAEAYAQKMHLKFPKINYEGISTQIASMFVDESDLDMPIIVYMPGIANKAYDPLFDPLTASFTETTNFTYTQEQSQKVMGLLECNVMQSKDILRQAVIKAIERKRKKDSLWSCNVC